MRQDPSLHDEQLEAEIRLVGDLVLAASQCEDHLSDDQIDAVLGLRPAASDAAGDRSTPAAGEADTGSGSHPEPGAAAPTAGEEG